MGVFEKLQSGQTSQGGVFGRLNQQEQTNSRNAMDQADGAYYNSIPRVDPAYEQAMAMNGEDQASKYEPVDVATKARNIPIVGGILRGLDAVANNPIVETVADIGRSFYIPGAGAANLAGLTGAAESAVSKFLPGVGSKMAQKAISEGVVGAPLGAGQTLMNNPDANLKDVGIGTAEGLALGAGLGAIGKYAGTKIGQALENWRATRNPQAEQQVSELLALPQGRGEQRLNNALDRSNLAPNESPIAGQGGVAEPLALPQGNYTPPTRLKVASGNQTLDYVMNQIKPEVDAAIAVPTRRDQLITYIQDHLQIPRDEIHNMPQADLQDLGQLVRENISVYDKAVQAASKRGYDLPSLLDGKAPNVSQQVARNAQERVAGVYPQEAPNISRPQSFNRSTVSGVGLPKERVGFADPKITYTPQRANVAQTDNIAPIPAVRKPRSIDPVQNEKPRGFSETLINSEKTPQGFVERLKSAYTPITNEQTLSSANKRINKDVEAATSYAMGNSRFTAEKATVAQRLIDHYNQQGNYQRAVDIAEKVSEEATRAGQSIQALSMFNRLTPEGVLVYAQRLAKKANESIPLGVKEIKVTEDVAAKLVNLTQVAQKMTGVKDLSNDVMNILDKAKTGEKLSETESATLKRFVNESKQFIQETTRKPKPPRPPQQPKDKRVRDNVVTFLDAQEQAAKERLRAKGIRISSTPLDIWADYAVIGASKMAKGTIKFADWSEQMIKDLGEDIRPHLEQLYERAAGAFEISAKKVTTQTIDRAEKLTEKVIQGKNLQGAEADSLRSLAQKVSSLSGEEKRLASQDLQIILQGLDNPSLLKKISTTQTIGQLLNPKTQVRNALGNELFYRIERLNKMFSTPIDIVRSKITGGDRTVTFRTNNQGEYWSNWMKGLKAGWKGTNVNGLETQYDLGSPTFKGKYNPLTYMEKSLGAALKSFDTAAYMRAFNNTLGEQATLRALNEGQAGNKALIEKYIRESDDNIMKIADQYGKYVTFQDNNIASKGLVALKKGLNFNKDFGIGDLILKYPKTPGAILMRALEYSPAGFLRSAAILARPIFKKEPTTAEVTQALSRAMIGTFGLSGLGYFLMDKGVVTGSASKDRDVRDLQRSAGQGQYQVNLSALFRLVKSNFDPDEAKLKEGDTLYTYDWMQPVSVAASLGANVNKNLNDGKSKLSGLAGTAYNSIEGGLSTITEQSVLSGLKRAVEGYPGQSVTDKITDILSDVPASFIPTAFNQVKQITDNARRETYSPNKLDQSLNKAKARIPGVAGTLPQQYDTLGDPKETYQNNSVGNVMFNPGFSSTYKLSPEAKMIVDLISESGDESLAPRVPAKSITVNGEKVQLTGDQFSRYQQLQGEETKKQLDKRYKPTSTLKSRVKQVEDILRDSGTSARDKLKKELSQ